MITLQVPDSSLSVDQVYGPILKLIDDQDLNLQIVHGAYENDSYWFGLLPYLFFNDPSLVPEFNLKSLGCCQRVKVLKLYANQGKINSENCDELFNYFWDIYDSEVELPLELLACVCSLLPKVSTFNITLCFSVVCFCQTSTGCLR